MKHVFVETNWVVDWAAPIHHQDAAASQLLADAGTGHHRLYLPAVCLTEARPPLLERFTPKLAPLRGFLKWISRQPDAPLTKDEIQATRKALDHYQRSVDAAQATLDARLASLRQQPGVEVFPLDDEMLERAVELTSENLQLKPFDQAILAAILVRAERLARDGESDFFMCELDADLQPWSREGSKQPLTRIYDRARIWVYGDFSLRAPAPYPGWPTTAAGS